MRENDRMDRVAVVAWAWFILWAIAGYAVGQLFGAPGTGIITAVCLALASVLVWPWVMPERINRWMDDLAS
jgi:hypothetical protein